MEKDGVWGDHLTLLALATALSYDIRIVTSAAGASDCYQIVVQPNGQDAFHDIPLLLGHHAEKHFVSLDIGIHAMMLKRNIDYDTASRMYSSR
jgi:hypothetical protein